MNCGAPGACPAYVSNDWCCCAYARAPGRSGASRGCAADGDADWGCGSRTAKPVNRIPSSPERSPGSARNIRRYSEYSVS